MALDERCITCGKSIEGRAFTHEKGEAFCSPSCYELRWDKLKRHSRSSARWAHVNKEFCRAGMQPVAWPKNCKVGKKSAPGGFKRSANVEKVLGTA